MSGYVDSKGSYTKPIGQWRALAMAAALLPFVVAAGIAVWTIAACGGAQFGALRQIAENRGDARLASARTPVGIKWRYLLVSRGTWSLRSGVPLAALLIPARSVELERRSPAQDIRVLGHLASLSHLFIMGPCASSRGMRVLRKLRSLRSLSILNISLTNADWEGLSGLKGLHKLVLGNDGLDDHIFALIATIENLRILDLSRNYGVVGEHMERVPRSHYIQRLYLDRTRFGDAGLRWVAGLPNLQYLDLASDAALRGNSLKSLAASARLRELDLSGTGIRDGDLHWIAAIHSLRVVSLEHTHCSPTGIAQLRRIDPVLQVRY